LAIFRALRLGSKLRERERERERERGNLKGFWAQNSQRRLFNFGWRATVKPESETIKATSRSGCGLI
jgi:hypothetical protein